MGMCTEDSRLECWVGKDGKYHGRGGESYPRFMCWYFMHLFVFACLLGELISYTFKS